METGSTLVIGGAASGKSAYAEAMVLAARRPCVYLATAEAHDAEMRAKIDRHIARRGPEWRTVTAPLDTAGALADLPGDAVCLLDCATMWLSNQMMQGNDLARAEAILIDAITACACPLIIVTNEVGHGIVPDNALARGFREAQGRLNIRLAAAVDRVVMITAGLPQMLKGGVQ